MRKLLRAGLVATGAIAVSMTSIVATAGPPSTTVRTIADRDGDGLLEYSAGEPFTVAGDYSLKGLHRVLSFVQMSDVHITDEESPGRLEFLDGVDPFGGAYRPNEALSTQTLEAAVERVRTTVSPLTHAAPNFTIVTGDMADSQQYNEARWLVDILDGGKTISPDSGTYPLGTTPTHLYDGVQGGQYYDPNGNSDASSPYAGLRNFPGLLEAAQQPFAAAGLGMPWYAVLGNHDELIQGNAPLAWFGPGFPNPNGSPATVPPGYEAANPSTQAVVIGSDKLLSLPPPDSTWTGTAQEWVLKSLADLLADPYTYVQAVKTAHPELVATVPPDPRRCYLAKDTPLIPAVGIPSWVPCQSTSWVDLLTTDGGSPTGHGIGSEATSESAIGRPLSARLTHNGYYSFTPMPGFRMIVLDTVTGWCTVKLCDWGSLDGLQNDWLKAQLTAADDEGQKVVVFSHHPLTDPAEPLRTPSENPAEPVWTSSDEVKAELCESPAVLATVSGHTHANKVNTIDCGSGTGFVSVNTTSEMDYPAQSRLVEIVANRDGKLALALSMIDNQSPPMVGSGAACDGPLALASIAREIGYRSMTDTARARATGGPEDRNVVIPLSR